MVSVEVTVKGYQAYKASSAAVLGEEMLCQREVGKRVDFDVKACLLTIEL